MKYRSILLFGAPGAGKGTQGKVLGVIPNFFHCACGDVFRNLRADSPLGKIFIKYSGRGQLVPDATTVKLWRQNIINTTKVGRFHPAQDTLVLDGIPRNVHQAKMLRDILDVVAVFYLKSADEKSLIHRIQRRAIKENRLDDANLNIIRERLKVYEEETMPVLNFYGRKCVHHINADQSPAKVLSDILHIAAKK
ncbi:MAG TPA: nucleoside monophosphate kinase [Verrucomicrobiae bacterium]